ncbi:MAG TPA: hypothetical protein VLK25_08655 [Allosphingosinicella sp.]|nr:hypothetical protein [Allosphingosinicella sp.]
MAGEDRDEAPETLPPPGKAGGGGGDDGGGGCGGDPTAFILDRTRSEVHLLLDNISANPEVTIAALSARMPPPDDLPADWIEQVCKITWPPKENNPQPDKLAKDAALLIRARDYLNGLAKPASGATIAFTLMVSQEERPRLLRLRRRSGGDAPPPSRSSLACDAYPDLIDRARIFRGMMTWVVWLAALALAMTLALSWYLAVVNAALADFTAARAELVQADARVGTAQSAMIAAAAAAEQSAEEPGGAGSPPPTQTAAPPRPDVFHLYPCGRTQRYTTNDMRDACLARTMAVERWVPVKDGLDTWSIGDGPYSAAWFATLLGSGILPVLYGFLGAIAAVVRTLSRKIKASLLSPRDIQLTFQQLALGAVIGACISLFIAAPGSGESETALLGPVTLSASAISFVAGFGVDSVFQALEALISRIFNIAPAGMGARAEQHPPS